MSEGDIRIMCVAKAAKELRKWVEIATQIHQNLGEKCQLLIISSVPGENIPDFITYHNVYDGHEAFQNDHKSKSRKEIGDALYEYADHILPTAYMSDERSILKADDDFTLAVEQLFLIRQALEIYDDFKPTHFFIGGAGTMIRTIFFALADVKCNYRYRVLGAHHMTPERKDMRYFFCDNELGDINNREDALFKHDDGELEVYADTILNSILNNNYKMDNYARSVGRYWRVSRPGLGLLRDLASMVKARLINDRLSYQKAKSKLIYAARSITQKRAYDSPSSLEHPFILLPLNVPHDAQLRLRAKEWQDTESLIRLFASNLPYGVQLAVKSHPGNPGMLSTEMIRRLRRDYPDIRFIYHDVNLRGLLEKCASVVVVNGSAALEASLLGKPCIYLGAAYLRRLPNVFLVKSVAQIERTIIRCLQVNLKDCSRGARDLLKKYYAQTYPKLNVREKNDLSKINRLIAEGIIELIRGQRKTLKA